MIYLGPDPRELEYDLFQHEFIAPGASFSNAAGWFVLDVKLFNGNVDTAFLNLVNPSGYTTNVSLVQPGGSLCFQPRGLFRGKIVVSGGTNAVIQIEYAFQTKQDGTINTVQVGP